MASARLRIAARVERLPEAVAFVEEQADRFGLGPKKLFGLTLALEEAFVNICHHAFPSEEGEAELACDGVGEVFVLEVADTGTPFDLLALPIPDLTADVMERRIGGLGVYFIRTFSDSVSYHREAGRNILRMSFNRA